MERIEKTVFISYRHTNSPRALAARIFAYQQLHSYGSNFRPWARSMLPMWWAVSSSLSTETEPRTLR
jgi:hypothetical protein